MGTYEQLKSAVAAVIHDNGAEEITGDVMQQVLITIINSLGAGATFAGVAVPTTNPSSPDAKMFYLAGKAGTYTNFNLTITKGLWVFENTTGTWVGHDLEVSMLFASGQDVTSTNIAATYTGAGDNDLVTVGAMNEAIGGIVGEVALNALDSTRTVGLFRVYNGLPTRVVGYLQVTASLSLKYVVQMLASDIAAFNEGSASADFKGHILTRSYNVSDSNATICALNTWTAWEEYGGGKFASGEKVSEITIAQTLGNSVTAIPSQAVVKSVQDEACAAVGYYECSTASATAAKVVNAAGYVLQAGGNIRIKMNNTNTADNATLNINGTGAKSLFYNGALASSSNSWNAGDVLVIYYDGTQYQVQESGGKAEKVQYDNSISELDASNVQSAIDEIVGVLGGSVNTPFTLTGAGNTGVSRDFVLSVGKTYTLTIDLSTFNYSSVSNGYNIFSLYYVNGSTETMVFRTMKGTDTPIATHTFTAVEADRYTVTIRANTGTLVSLSLAADGEFSIDDAPTENSRKLVRSGGVYSAIQESIRPLTEVPISLTGAGSTGVGKQLQLTAGKTYTLTIDLSTFNYSSISNGINIFSLYYVNGSTETMVFRTMKGTDTPVAVHTFTAVEADYYLLTIRANSGTNVSLSLVEGDAEIAIDERPTENSLNLVRSGGVYADAVAKLDMLGKELTLSDFTCSWATNSQISSGYLKTRYRCAIKVPSIPAYIKVENVPSGYYAGLQSNYTLADALSAQVYPVDYTSWGVTEHTFTNEDAQYLCVSFKIGSAGSTEFTQTDMDALAASVTVSVFPWVDSGNNSSTDIISLNKDAEFFLKSAVLRDHGWANGTYTDKTKPAVFLHFSDLHANAANLARIVQFHSHYATYFNDVIATGDMVRDKLSDDWTFWNNAGAQGFLQSTGNHEYYNSSYGWVTSLEVYQKFFGNIGTWGVTQPTDAATNGYCFYYKDYADYKLRIVVLDSIVNLSAQVDWVEDILADAKTLGYHVAFFCHTAPFNKTSIPCSFQTLTDWDSWFAYRDYMNDIAAKVDEFKSGGGKFVAWFCGHTHRDFFSTLTDYPSQLFVAIACATDMSDWTALEKGTDMVRVPYEKSMDCMNIISIDTDNNRLKIKRIGVDVDRDLRYKNSIVYDYANMEVLYND